MKKPTSYEAGYLRILSTPKFGGDKRDRTADLLNAIQALSWYKRVANPLKWGQESAFGMQEDEKQRKSPHGPRETMLLNGLKAAFS